MDGPIGRLQAELERRDIPYELHGSTLRFDALCECVVECSPWGNTGIWYSPYPDCDYVADLSEVPMVDRLLELCQPYRADGHIITGDSKIDGEGEDGTCHDVSNTLGRWKCSRCGKAISVALTDLPPRFCAGCGRRVIELTKEA